MQRGQARLIAGAALGLAVGFGPCFIAVAGLFLKPMALAFDWSRADVSMLPMLAMLGAGIGSPLIGYIADRAGWSKVIGLSILFFALGLLALAAAQPSYLFLVCAGVFIGVAGTATNPLGYLTVISLAFERGLGTALGLAHIGVGAGSFLMPIVAGSLLGIIDWRQAYACFALIALAIGFVAHRLIFRAGAANASAARTADSGRNPEEPPPEAEGVSFGQAARTLRFWLIGVVAGLVAATAVGANIHLASYVTDQGLGLGLAARATGLIGVGIVSAGIGTGFLLDRFFAPLVAVVAFLLGALGFYLLFAADIAHSPWPLFLAAFLIGSALGTVGNLLPFLVKKYLGVRAFGSIFGALFGVFSVGAITGTYLFGLSFDLLSSYLPVLQASAALLCVSGFATLALGRYRYASADTGH